MVRDFISEVEAPIRQASLSLLIVIFGRWDLQHNVSFDAVLEAYVSDTYKVNLFQEGGRWKGVNETLGSLQLFIVGRLEFTYIQYILYVTEWEMFDIWWFQVLI